jgi:hypothetical protein
MQFDDLAKVGPKIVVTGKQAVCSSSQPSVTDTMIQVMKDGRERWLDPGCSLSTSIKMSLFQTNEKRR